MSRIDELRDKYPKQYMIYTYDPNMKNFVTSNTSVIYLTTKKQVNTFLKNRKRINPSESNTVYPPR